VKPNVRTYTALITALGNGKQWSRALNLLRSLKNDASSGRVEPNAYTYSALLKTMGEHGQWQLAEQVGATLFVQRNGLLALLISKQSERACEPVLTGLA
jgi:pentatricopeptide repeat protein